MKTTKHAELSNYVTLPFFAAKNYSFSNNKKNMYYYYKLLLIPSKFTSQNKKNTQRRRDFTNKELNAKTCDN